MRKGSNSNGGGKKIKLNESLQVVEEKNSSSNSQINLAKNTQRTKLTDFFEEGFIMGSVKKIAEKSAVETENVLQKNRLISNTKASTDKDNKAQNLELEKLNSYVEKMEKQLKEKDIELNMERAKHQVFIFNYSRNIMKRRRKK